MKKFLIVLSAFLVLLTAPALAATDNNNKIFQACDDTPNSAICQDRNQQNGAASTNPVNHYIHVAANLVAGLTGAAAIILIIISAFKFITGGSTPETVKSARSTLIAAVVGLAIVALAWTIINFAIDLFIS